jgi:effector-binding domain-containing protein
MPDENANDEMDELIRRRTQMEMPVEVEERLRGRLMEFRTKVEQRRPGRLRTLAYSLIHLPPARVMAIAAAFVAMVAVGLVLIPWESRASRVFAAAAAQLRSSQSLEYTIVLNAEPYVAIDFSYLAPGYGRFSCSWGIEARADTNAGKQLILMHATRQYLIEGRKQAESLVNTEDIAEQLRSLPPLADEVLGEQWAGGKKLIGYRLSKAPPNGGIAGLKSLDIWVDAGTREANHVDITVQEGDQPVHQMHIQNIRVNSPIDRSLFDLTPPAGYTAIAKSGPDSQAQTDTGALPVKIGHADALVAVVVPMKGSYQQTSAALQSVEGYLKTLGITPAGAPFGRYWSEQHWEAGYPVAAGIQVKAPYQLISLPAGLAASAVVKGPWGKDSDAHWGAFVKSVIEQGYLPTGPAMEIWSGGDAKQGTPSTEMRMPVAKAN